MSRANPAPGPREPQTRPLDRSVELPDGRSVRWEGFQTGPVVLRRADVEQMSSRLLGRSLVELRRDAASALCPVTSRSTGAPALVIHSATPLKRSFEADLQSLAHGHPIEDPPSYIETRSVYLAAPGDLIVGRLAPWRDAASLAGLDTLQVPHLDYYYLSHALLKLAAGYPEHGADTVGRLVRWLREHPTALVKVYALDEELLVFLLWLRRQAGLERLHVEANSLEVSGRWAQKAPLHPWVFDAAGLAAAQLHEDPYRQHAAEQECTPFWRELGLRLPVLPGYTIRAEGDATGVRTQLDLAARLLGERYGLRRGCLKPSKAGTGAGIRTGLDLDDGTALHLLASEIHHSGEDAVLEAHLDYGTLDIAGRRFILAPSMHIEADGVAPGMTLQFLHGTMWEGNVYFDELHNPGLEPRHYALLRDVMERFVQGFRGASPPSGGLGLTKGGVDFGIGRLGGKFGEDPMVGLQDLNLLSHGAEYLRAFMRKAAAGCTEGTGDRVYGVTRVVHPSPDASLEVLLQAMPVGLPGVHCEPIASVPGRWAMIAAATREPIRATRQVLALERDLLARGLLTPPAAGSPGEVDNHDA